MCGYPSIFNSALTNEITEGFVEGGALWFVDLSMPDELMVIPLLTAGMHWINLDIHMGNLPDNSRIKVVKSVLRGFVLLMIPIGINLPAVL